MRLFKAVINFLYTHWRKFSFNSLISLNPVKNTKVFYLNFLNLKA